MTDKKLLEFFHFQIDSQIRRALKLGRQPTYLQINLDDNTCFMVDISEEVVAAIKSTATRQNE